PVRSAISEERDLRICPLGHGRDRPHYAGVSPGGMGFRMGFAPANGMRARFIEGTLASLIAASEYAPSAVQMALTGGGLQRVEPRVKMAGLFGLVIVVAASRQLLVIASLFAVALLLAIFSQVRLG